MNTSALRHKRLRFSTALVPLVISGEKTATWRLWDDKELMVGDVLDLINAESGEQFGVGRISQVIEKPMGMLTDEDKRGHEQFANDEEMYATYQGYYQQLVGPETVIKIVWFELI